MLTAGITTLSFSKEMVMDIGLILMILSFVLSTPRDSVNRRLEAKLGTLMLKRKLKMLTSWYMIERKNKISISEICSHKDSEISFLRQRMFKFERIYWWKTESKKYRIYFFRVNTISLWKIFSEISHCTKRNKQNNFSNSQCSFI